MVYTKKDEVEMKFCGTNRAVERRSLLRSFQTDTGFYHLWIFCWRR